MQKSHYRHDGFPFPVRKNRREGGTTLKTISWGEKNVFQPDIENPMNIVKNVAFEMKKRSLQYVLELGCGQGRNAIYLAREGFFVVGIDNDVKDLLLFRKYIKTHALTANIVQNNVSDLSFKDNRFEAVLCFNALTFVREHERSRVAGEVKRVLRPQGLFVAIERSLKDPMYGKGKEVEHNSYLFQGTVLHFFPLDELKALLSPMEIVVLHENRSIDASHGQPHVHGTWTIVASNCKE